MAEEIIGELKQQKDLVRGMFDIANNQENYKKNSPGEGTYRRYFSAGSFDSGKYGEQHVGVKTPKSNLTALVDADYMGGVVYAQLLIEEFGKEIEEFLPTFYGIMLDKDGEKLATFSEDFSKGGKHEVWDYAVLPSEIALKLMNHELGQYHGIWLSEVNNEAKIVDLNGVYPFLLSEKYSTRFYQLMEIENENRMIREQDYL